MDGVTVAAALPPPALVHAGPGASLADAGAFQGAMAAAASGMAAAPVAAAGPDAVGPALKGMFTSLDQVDREAKSVAAYAEAASASGSELTPGEVIQLTMRCHEFMFHCQLTSNIANRSSDGLQQLFRQQS